MLQTGGNTATEDLRWCYVRPPAVLQGWLPELREEELQFGAWMLQAGEGMLPELCGGATRAQRHCFAPAMSHRAPATPTCMEGMCDAGRRCCIGNSLDGVLRRGPRQGSPAMEKHTRRGSQATFPTGFSGDGETPSTGFFGDGHGSRGSNRNTGLRKQQRAGSVSLFFGVIFKREKKEDGTRVERSIRRFGGFNPPEDYQHVPSSFLEFCYVGPIVSRNQR